MRVLITGLEPNEQLQRKVTVSYIDDDGCMHRYAVVMRYHHILHVMHVMSKDGKKVASGIGTTQLPGFLQTELYKWYVEKTSGINI